ncbi:MAG: hypothetical protein U0872_13475 [Planctomycetaceae bacterium]
MARPQSARPTPELRIVDVQQHRRQHRTPRRTCRFQHGQFAVAHVDRRVTDATGTSVNAIPTTGTFTGVGITLADQATDTLTARLKRNGFDFQPAAAHDNRPGGNRDFGSLTFNSTNSVSVQEDSATNLTGSSTANSLSLTSTGAITDATGTSLDVTNNGTFTGVGGTLADQRRIRSPSAARRIWKPAAALSSSARRERKISAR